MLEKSYGKFQIVCDVCGHCSGNEYDSWQEALDNKRYEDFVSKKINGEWMDVCEECQ